MKKDLGMKTRSFRETLIILPGDQLRAVRGLKVKVCVQLLDIDSQNGSAKRNDGHSGVGIEEVVNLGAGRSFCVDEGL